MIRFSLPLLDILKGVHYAFLLFHDSNYASYRFLLEPGITDSILLKVTKIIELLERSRVVGT